MKQHRDTLAALRVSRWVYGGAFLIPLVILCLAFWHLKLAPFGPKNLLFSDMGAQYVPILEYLRTTILHGQFHLFSLSLGTGSGIVPLLTYYVISPFNLIVFLFPAAHITTALSWIILLKVSTIGLTMAVFLRHAFLKSGWSLLLFSTAFSLCGFVAMYFYDMMWLDALIWLPLVALGLHRLVDQHHFGLYTVSLTATILSNYYMGYMTCLFSVLYFIYLIVEHQPTKTKFLSVLKMHTAAIRQFFIGSLLAGGMTAVVLLPTALGMLLTGKSDVFYQNYLPSPLFGPEVLAQFGPGGSTYVTHLYHAPTLFMGTLMFLLVIVYFVSPRIRAVEKNRTMWLLIVMGLGLFVTLFNTAWHMFQQPAGFPFRNAYFFTFLLLITAYRAWQTHPAQSMNDPQKILALVWGAGLLIVGYLSAHVFPKLYFKAAATLNNTLYLKSQPSFHWMWLSLGLLLLSTMLLFISEWRPIRIGLLGLLLATELGGNYLVANRGIEFGNQAAFEKYYRQDKALLAQVNASQTTSDLHRVEFLHATISKAYDGPYNHYNDPLLFNYSGISSYSSTLVEQARVFQHDLGYFSPNVRRISPQGYTHVTDTLIGVKYRLNAFKDPQITPLSSYAGLGFAVPAKLAKVQLNDQQALYNQEKVLRALGAPQNTLALTSVLNVSTRRATAHDMVNIPGKFRTLKHDGDRYLQTVKLRVNATGLLHGYSPDNNIIYSSLRVNGKKAKPLTNADGLRYVINLGQHQRGTVLTVSYVTNKPTEGYHNQFVSLNQRLYRQFTRQLRQQSLHFRADNQVSRLSGDVQGTPERNLLYLAIPDTPGWSATVNGKPVTITSAMHAQSLIPVVKNYKGMIGVPLQNGQNHVVLRYRTPGLRAGAIISLACLVLFGVLWFTGEWLRPLETKHSRRHNA
ncbi:YfhO family protein [Levilactobacillus namurensis]|uniref:YfhO family protein n=1 Tax=Levilactobacillus namurensis TaxID=380393 RepID=UPI0004674784|nr:YfhO family protein [Levilactobacillus namurensis]